MIYLCLGRREVGKTTLAYYLAQQEHVRAIFDPRGLFPASARLESGVGIQERFDTAFERKHGEIVLTPDSDLQEMFDRFSREVKKYLKDGGRLAFVVDEIRFVDTERSAAFDWVLRCTEREQSTIVLTAHRPADIPVNVRAIVDVWCLFQMTQEHDLKVINERCSPEVADLIPTLEPRQFIAWNDTKTSGNLTKHYDPKSWYVPLGLNKKLTAGGVALPTGEVVSSKAIAPKLAL